MIAAMQYHDIATRIEAFDAANGGGVGYYETCAREEFSCYRPVVWQWR